MFTKIRLKLLCSNHLFCNTLCIFCQVLAGHNSQTLKYYCCYYTYLYVNLSPQNTGTSRKEVAWVLNLMFATGSLSFIGVLIWYPCSLVKQIGYSFPPQFF